MTIQAEVDGGAHDEQVASVLQQVLDRQGTMALATTNSEEPWIAGCYFAYESPYRLQLILETHGSTMANARSQPRVAVSLTTGNPFEPFAQGAGSLTILGGDDVAAAHARLLSKNPEMEPLFAMPIDTVAIDIDTWKITDISNGWLPAKVLRPS